MNRKVTSSEAKNAPSAKRYFSLAEIANDFGIAQTEIGVEMANRDELASVTARKIVADAFREQRLTND